MDNRNVLDMYKDLETELIREKIGSKKHEFAVCGQHIYSDFNFSCIVRSANSFGAKEIFYVGGKKHWDKRGAVGTYHYSSVNYLKEISDLKLLKDRYRFVALENNITQNVISLKTYNWQPSSLILVGEEKDGLVPELLELCDDFVEIPSFGSVRSLNAASAASIAMYDYVAKL